MRTTSNVHRMGDDVTGITSDDDGSSCRLTLVLPRRFSRDRQQEIAGRVWRLCVELGHPPRVLAGKNVRVLTGIHVYCDC